MIHVLSLLLSLGLSVQGGPAHAALHPAEADVYLELGDVNALLTALDRTPMARFLRDERLKPLFTQLGQAPDRSLKELARTGLLSVLPEAKPEGWMDGLKTLSASITALGPETDTTDSVALLAVADLTTPEQAQALHTAILANVPKHEPMTSAVAGVERLHFGAKAADDLWCVAIGPRLAVGGSGATPEDFVARADKKAPGLAGRETFQKQLAALDKASGTPLLWFALARPLSEILATSQEKGIDFLEQLPGELNPFASARVARMQLVGERFVTEMISSEPAGAAVKAVDPAWLEPVPSGSMIVFATAFDGASAAKRVRALIAKDEQGAATLAALEQKLGFGPEKVLAHLGPGLTVYAAPLAGLGLPETRVWIDCDDSAAFTSEFEALMGALGETLPGFTAKTKPYKLKKAGSEEKVEVPLTTLSLPPGAIPIPMISVAPSFAPVGKKLVFGLNSMDVKNELKRVHSGEGEPLVAGANPLGALGFSLPAETRAVFVMDWAKLFSGILGTVKAFAGMAPPEQMPFDLAKLPPPEMFAEFFKPTFHYSRGIAGGAYRRNEASFGPETWSMLVGAGLKAAQAQRQAFESASSPVPPPKPAGQ